MIKKTILLLIALALVPVCLFAQAGEIVFTRVTKENGFASSRANAILKDHQGYYWISSYNGLQRFDGRRMVSFRHNQDDPASLPDNTVVRLIEDSKKRLWLSAGDNPYIYDPLHRDFKKIPVDYPGKDAFSIFSFFQDSKGLFWMVTGDADLFVLDTIHTIFRSYSTIWPKCPAHIVQVMEDKSTGYYWLITDKGVMIYDPQKKEYYNSTNNPYGFRCFRDPVFSLAASLAYKDYNDILWMQSWDPARGFIHYRYDIKKDELAPINLNKTHLWGFLTDISGTTWCYGNILGHYDSKTNEFTEIPGKKNSLYGIDFNEIYNMSQDAENNIWVMTNLGLYYFNLQQQFFSSADSVWSFRAKKALNGNTNGFVETKDGHIITLSWGGDGLNFYDTAFKRVPALYGFDPLPVKDPDYLFTWCGIQDSKGIIWIGCQHGHILQLNPATKKVISLIPPQFENRTIRSMTEDKDGNIWFGTQNNIIVKWDRSSNSFKQIVPLSQEKYNLGWIIRILPGYDNDLWVGTIAGGLLHIDLRTEQITKQFLHDKSHPHSISNSGISEIVAINPDTLAIATASGIDLFNWRQEKFFHMNEKDGLPAEGIISMIKDDRGNLWFSSVDGISKIHLPDKRIHNYGSSDGITEGDFQLGSVACLQNRRLLFGNTSGFVSFNPERANEADVPSDVIITGFNIFNHSLSIDSLFRDNRRVRLSHSENYITIQFASLSNIMSNRLDYYYMLEGIDKDWVRASGSQEAIYTYIPGGTYTFKVRCVSQDGVLGKNITSFTIYVSPPFWKTWWFMLLLLVIVGAVSYYIYLLRMRRRHEREIIRNRIARDLHDDMGSTLSTINILSSMAKSKLNTDEVKTSEYINKIGDNSQRMMEAMDDIVWAIKPDNDSMQKIVARMREFSTSLLEAKDIDLEFRVDEKVNDVKLNMEQRRDFFLLFKEAVNNVAKYAKCKKTVVQLGVRQSRLVLIVEDNGVGFDAVAADNGNGLGNMQKRADSLKGRLQIQSKPGEGTTVTLNIPVK